MCSGGGGGDFTPGHGRVNVSGYCVNLQNL